MSVMTYREAVAEALADELERDDSVFVLGEDVAAAGGVFKATQGLLERFGADRVRNTPISEQAIVGCALGAAATGLRPVAEVMFADFAGVCFDQIANQVAKHRYMSGGQATVPLTIRLANGAGLGFGAQHSQAVENWFLGIPGLKVCVPGTPADLYGLLRAAVQDDNPVLVFEHKALYGVKDEVPRGEELPQIGRAAVVREGRDATVVATQLAMRRALQAAERLADDGIDVELIDLRTLVPLDVDAVVASVAKTSRLVCVQESSFDGSWGAALIGHVAVSHFDLLDAAPLVVGGDDTPIPYAAALEEAWLPSVERIAEAIRRALA